MSTLLTFGLANIELLKRRLNRIMDRNAPKRLLLSARFVVVLAGLLLSPRLNLSAPAKAEKGEDAETFLPSPMPLQGAALSVGGVAFSPDGKILAMGAAGPINSSASCVCGTWTSRK